MEVTRRTLLAGAAGLALAGCTQSTPSSPPTETPTETPPVTPTPPADPRPRWPLTGRLLDDPAAARHAAVAVKVPDNRNEHPQAGINDADIVFVQLEGYLDSAGQSATRLVPVFHSSFAKNVAPVRSMRPVDVPALGPMGALIGSTGATPWVENYIRSMDAVVDGTHTYLASKGTGAYSINQARVRTYQGQTYYDRAIVCHPAELAKLASGTFAEGPKALYFPFATGDAVPSTASGTQAKLVRVPWKAGASYDMVYLFDAPSGVYLRSMPWGPHVLADGQRVTTDNVLVIRTHQHFDKIYAGDGPADPIHDVIDASGTFVYANGGAYVTGTWAKAGVEAPWTFTLDDGRPLVMAPGRTFVELAGQDADVRFS